MQIVQAVADARVLDAGGEPVYTLRAGRQYVLHDAEAAHGLRGGALKLVEGLDRRLPAYRGEPLSDERMLLPFIGRRGDAIVAASCLCALIRRYPEVKVDIAAPQAALDVLELMPSFGELLTYPLTTDHIDEHNYYLSFEEIQAVPRGWHRSCADVFSACLHTPRPSAPPPVTVPPDQRARWALGPSARPRVAVHAGAPDNVRSYPPDLLDRLAARLADDGVDVYLVGANGPAHSTCSWSSPRIHDLRGRTPQPADLAAVFEQVDAVVTSDSFPMHLAGAIGTATLALFTATDAVIGTDYPSVVPVRSNASCSPCHIPTGPCPRGHRECAARREHSLSPDVLAERVGSLLTVAGAV